MTKKACYFLVVKENQGTLNEQLTDAFRYNKSPSRPREWMPVMDRIETRDYHILNADVIEDKEVLARWPCLKILAEVTFIVDYGNSNVTTKRDTKHTCALTYT